MKTNNKIIIFAIIAAVYFISCKEDDPDPNPVAAVVNIDTTYYIEAVVNGETIRAEYTSPDSADINGGIYTEYIHQTALKRNLADTFPNEKVPGMWTWSIYLLNFDLDVRLVPDTLHPDTIVDYGPGSSEVTYYDGQNFYSTSSYYLGDSSFTVVVNSTDQDVIKGIFWGTLQTDSGTDVVNVENGSFNIKLIRF